MMKLPFKPLLAAGALLFVPLLDGCHGNVGSDGHGSRVEFTMKNGSLTLRKHIVIVKVSGHDPAYVTTHGHLVIGDTNADEVPTNDEQRAALAAYNKAANTMIDKGIDVGVEGAHVAADAIGIVIKDAVNGNTQDIDKDVKKGVQPVKGKVDELCNQLDAWRQAQNEVARLIPAFEPYAIIEDTDVKDCHDHGIDDDDDSSADEDGHSADKGPDSHDGADDASDDSDRDADTDSSGDSPAKATDGASPTVKHGDAHPAPAAPPAPAQPAAPAPPPAKGAVGGSTRKSLTV